MHWAYIRQACSPLIQLFFGFASDIDQKKINRDIRDGNWLSISFAFLTMVSCQNDVPWAWGSIYVTVLTMSLLKMVLKGGRQVKALEAEGADEPLLRRVPVLTVLSCAGR